jgi:hypothetical protein
MYSLDDNPDGDDDCRDMAEVGRGRGEYNPPVAAVELRANWGGEIAMPVVPKFPGVEEVE